MSGPIDDIRAFCRVVELGSISAAARVLGETKGGISRRISRLEQGLGAQLLARHPRSVSPTGEGKLFFAKAREGLLLLEEGAELARESRTEPRGILRLTAPQDLSHTWLPPLLVAFSQRYPRLTVELLASDQRLDLAGHQIDVALRATLGGLPDMGYSARQLTALPMGFFASPAYLAANPAPRQPTELHAHALILPLELLPGFRLELAHPAGQREQLTLTPRLGAGDYASVLQLTLAGGGIGYCPALVAAAAVARGELLPQLTDWQAPSGELYLITLSGQRAPAKVRAFKEFMAEVFGLPG